LNHIAIFRRTLCIGLCAIYPAIIWTHALKNEYALMIFCDPVAGQESEFEIWWPAYVRSVATVPGVAVAEKFRRAEVRLRVGAQPLPAHLALLSITASDIAAVVREIDRRKTDGKIAMSTVVDEKTAREVAYRVEGVWEHKPASTGGAIYLQIVLADPVPGQAAEYNRWFDQSHGPQLASVHGVYEVKRGVRCDVALIPGEDAAGPAYLSAMHFQTRAILTFKEVLERAARNAITPSTSYDIAHAWRETYEQTGRFSRGTAKP
jgi:hypothetical protein